MASEFRMERLVEFADTDMAGIAHFSNYFRYMEATEHAFVRSLGETLHMEVDGRMLGFARVHAECDYLAPLRYQDVVTIHLCLREKRASTLTYDFTFRRRSDEVEVARGSLVVCCVTRAPGEIRLRPTPIPESLDRLLEPASD